MTENTDESDRSDEQFVPTNHFSEDRVEKEAEIANEFGSAYPNVDAPDMSLAEYRSEYLDAEAEETVTLMGRVTRVNDLNGIAFLDIEDETGGIQIIFDDDETERFDSIGLIDTADIIQVTGVPHTTNTGEFSLLASEYVVATKALNHPPDPSGMSSQQRVRNRTAALWEESLHNSVRTRFEMTRYIRNFLEDADFLEVETPILQNTAGGASATPFETYCEATEQDMSLRIAPELYLKRLVAGGFDRIFEVGRVFRNEDIDTSHNPEFTMLELYQAYATYEDMMALTENLVAGVMYDQHGDYTVTYDGTKIDFEPPWPRMTLEESLAEYGDVTVSDESTSSLRNIVEDVCPESVSPNDLSRGELYMELYDSLVEPEIEGPLFITDHPTESTPLCKTHSTDESHIERFEVVVAGVELANAYTEMNNPIEQAELFIDQQGVDNLDEAYVESLGYGLPPTGGLGIGVDRLAMFVTDSQSIKDVLPFPMVRPDN